MKLLCKITLLCLVASLPGNCLRAAPPASLQVSGAVIKPGVWDAARLRRELPRDVTEIAYTLKGHRHTAHAVPLWTLIQAAGPRVNPQIKHHLLQFVVTVRGQDGYTADFTLGELSPDFGDRPVWVALDEDGRPLMGDGGPVQLLVPGDKKPARWVHAVRAVILTDGALASAPAGTS
jgi:hypothetical protein